MDFSSTSDYNKRLETTWLTFSSLLVNYATCNLQNPIQLLERIRSTHAEVAKTFLSESILIYTFYMNSR